MSNGSEKRTSSPQVDSKFIAEISKDSTDTDLVLIDDSGALCDSLLNRFIVNCAAFW